ncbi:MAG TPA: hypothetical protein VFS81_13355, partial [Candidatus Binatia bacterium]|nr:hypothetical protein [Candidatus Binatia bacterium]
SHTVVLETSANPQKPFFRKRLLDAEIDLPALFMSENSFEPREFSPQRQSRMDSSNEIATLAFCQDSPLV